MTRAGAYAEGGSAAPSVDDKATAPQALILSSSAANLFTIARGAADPPNIARELIQSI